MAAIFPQSNSEYGALFAAVTIGADFLVENTGLVGQIKMEVNCLPVENAEYRRVMDRRAKQAMKPKRETKLLTGVISSHGGNLLAPGTLGSGGSFDTFIVSHCALSEMVEKLTWCRRIPGQVAGNRRSLKLLGYLRTSCWTRFTTVLNATITGR